MEKKDLGMNGIVVATISIFSNDNAQPEDKNKIKKLLDEIEALNNNVDVETQINLYRL